MRRLLLYAPTGRTDASVGKIKNLGFCQSVEAPPNQILFFAPPGGGPKESFVLFASPDRNLRRGVLIKRVRFSRASPDQTLES
jgi:hypothetical protein